MLWQCIVSLHGHPAPPPAPSLVLCTLARVSVLIGVFLQNTCGFGVRICSWSGSEVFWWCESLFVRHWFHVWQMYP